MGDSLSNADIIDGACGIAACGDSACLVIHTLVGIAADQDGNAGEIGGVAVMRIDDRLRGADHTEALCHEWAHRRFPDWGEDAALLFGKQMAAILHLPEVIRRSFS